MDILIAEDACTSRRMLEKALTRWGYNVFSAKDGKEAWDILKGPDKPPVAILDWMMPEINGVEICSRLRESDRHLTTYIILLTSRDNQDDIIEGLEAGADDYITKPFQYEELRARVRVGERIVSLQADLKQQVNELKEALSHIKTLQGIIPICMHCHKIRDDQDSWQRLEKYISDNSDANFSHGICPDCRVKFYSD